MYFRPHEDVIKWKHFPLWWSFVRGVHQSSVDSPHKGQWFVDLVYSLICAWTNGWANNLDAGDLWRHRALYGYMYFWPHDDVIKWKHFPRYWPFVRGSTGDAGDLRRHRAHYDVTVMFQVIVVVKLLYHWCSVISISFTMIFVLFCFGNRNDIYMPFGAYWTHGWILISMNI